MTKRSKMIPIQENEVKKLLDFCGLTREEFANLRNVHVSAVHSWMRSDRNKIPEYALNFLRAYAAVLPKCSSRQEVLDSIPYSIRKNGNFDPINNSMAVKMTDGELVDELEKRGWTVSIARSRS